MQNVQPFGFFFREDSRYYWINDSFDRAIAQCQDKRAGPEHPVAIGKDGDKNRTHMADKGKPQRPTIANLINHQTKKNDTNGKWPQPNAK